MFQLLIDLGVMCSVLLRLVMSDLFHQEVHYGILKDVKGMIATFQYKLILGCILMSMWVVQVDEVNGSLIRRGPRRVSFTLRKVFII